MQGSTHSVRGAQRVPFWTDDFPRPADLPSGDSPREVDVAIIGGGITGLTAARQLARAGIAVAVLEARAIGDGASAINGGMAIYGLKADAQPVMAQFGGQLGRELWDASNEAIDRIEQIVEEEDIECAFSRPGSVELGFTTRDEQTLAEHARWTTDRLGLPIDYLPKDRVRTVAGSDRFSVALTEKTSAGLHPARYTFGLTRAAVRAGASIIEHAEVTQVDRSTAGFVVHTSRGVVNAGRVLVTTNGYTGNLFPHIRRGIVPLGSYSVVTEPLPRDLAEQVLPGNRMAWTSRRFLNYFRRTPDDRILLGGRRNLRTDLDLTDSARDLHARLLDFFPQLHPYAITHVWGGKLGATFDLLPHIGERDGIWHALGYGGHGVALGTYIGTDAGKLMAGELDRSPFADIPFPTRWYYRRTPWFLPLAAWWFRVLDRVGR